MRKEEQQFPELTSGEEVGMAEMVAWWQELSARHGEVPAEHSEVLWDGIDVLMKNQKHLEKPDWENIAKATRQNHENEHSALTRLKFSKMYWHQNPSKIIEKSIKKCKRILHRLFDRFLMNFLLIC